MDKNFQKNIAYNVLQLAVKARNDLLYAHQIIGETYVMREDYKMPFNTESDLYHANEKCAKNAIPALNEIVAHTASLYVRCCEDLARREQEENEK